jgi:hypothetical protein
MGYEQGIKDAKISPYLRRWVLQQERPLQRKTLPVQPALHLTRLQAHLDEAQELF